MKPQASPIWDCSACMTQLFGGPRCHVHNPTPEEREASVSRQTVEDEEVAFSMATNYLELGAIANGRPARMARYFAQTAHTPGAVAIVATFSPRDWRAYIGSCDGLADYGAAADQVAAWGAKLSEEDARHFFPDVTLPYAAD